MSASRTASRPASRPASFYIGSRLAYDVATQDFIDRAQALDSTAFDLTASNSLYTPGYVKAQWDTLVRGLKADGAWNAITEWVPMRGMNYINSGALPKLKYASGGAATVTNNGFVTGDFDPIVGMTGDGTSWLDTGYWFPNFDGDDLHLGVTVEALASSSTVMMGARDGGSGPGIEIVDNGIRWLYRLPSTDADIQGTPLATGHLIASRRSPTDLEGYRDGASDGTDSSSASVTSANYTVNLGIFCRNIDTGTQGAITDATLSHAHYGTGVTTAQALAISTRIAAFNAALA